MTAISFMGLFAGLILVGPRSVPQRLAGLLIRAAALTVKAVNDGSRDMQSGEGAMSARVSRP